jgi:septum formation protein
MPPLILASTSPHRRALLERLRVPFTCEPPHVDEDTVKRSEPRADTVVRTLARAKALAVAACHPAAIVIGSDQAAVVDGALLDKPGTAANAIAQLQRLQGREHALLTAVAIAHPRGVVEFVATTTLRMRALTVAEIERYVAADRPLDCAGSYKVESLGIALFDAIAGDDHTAIVGLPLLRTCRELRALGVALP